MKNVFTILALISLGNIFAQDLEKIKKADTIFIYFKEDKVNQIHHIEKGKTNRCLFFIQPRVGVREFIVTAAGIATEFPVNFRLITGAA